MERSEVLGGFEDLVDLVDLVDALEDFGERRTRLVMRSSASKE